MRVDCSFLLGESAIDATDGAGMPDGQVTGCRVAPAAWLYKSAAAVIAALMVL